MSTTVGTKNHHRARLWATLMLGFASGLPLALSGETLKAWYASAGVSLTSIGFLSLIGIPYTFKFLLAPFLDRYWLPGADRRKSWIVCFQALLCLTLLGMSTCDPTASVTKLGILAVALAFFSASQDIVVDAYKVDLLDKKEQALGAALGVNGYRIAMLVSGGLCLVLAGQYDWATSYQLMALLMGVLSVSTYFAPATPIVEGIPKTLKACLINPFQEFFNRKQALMVLCFIVLYKLGDAFAGSLTIAFLVREIKFDLTVLGSTIKVVGFLATILGTTAGALLVNRKGWFWSLFWFGILQALANLSYCLLLWKGPDLSLATCSIFLDNFFGGMGTAAFAGWLISLCDKRFSAFQYALLSSLSAIGRVFIGPLAGIITEQYGWKLFFVTSLWISIPGLILLALFRYALVRHGKTHWALASA
ncbi:MAG: muropeptide transporter AmpG [Pseudomonadota bacterium]|jgi:PAT family beta-lactamase induction signal transducer AmpG